MVHEHSNVPHFRGLLGALAHPRAPDSSAPQGLAPLHLPWCGCSPPSQPHLSLHVWFGAQRMWGGGEGPGHTQAPGLCPRCALSASPTPFHPSWSPRLRVNGGLPSPRRWEQSFCSCAWTWSALLDGAGYPCTVHVCHTTFVHRAEVGLVATDAWSPARTREGSGL